MQSMHMRNITIKCYFDWSAWLEEFSFMSVSWFTMRKADQTETLGENNVRGY